MSTSPQAERLLIRVHGDASLPTLIYLPGLHGDWTLVSSFRAAVAGCVRFVEFTYPRSLTTSAADYAAWVEEALAAQGITQGWLLAESFGSQVAWALIERHLSRQSAASGIRHPGSGLGLDGLILVGGFVKHPWPWGARFLRWQAAHTPARLLRVALRGYEAYAGFRHRHAPETQASIREFVERRTPLDSEAIRARLELIAANDPRPIARRTTLPVHYLAGLVDPLVPWPFVRWWLRRHCPAYRGGTTLWSADHNALATKPRLAAEFVLGVIGALSSSRSTAQAHFGSSPS
jgi:pimeloyl-ACP methyl ester carboxylesterase